MTATETNEARGMFAAERARLITAGVIGCTADIVAIAERAAWRQYRDANCWGVKRPGRIFTLNGVGDWLWALSLVDSGAADAVRDLTDRQWRRRHAARKAARATA